MDIATSLNAQLQRITESVQDGIAIDGLVALKRVLDAAGFGRSQYLKNYEVLSHVSRSIIVFEILVDLESVDIDQKKLEEHAKKSVQAFGEAAERTYKIISRGGFDRVARMKDHRKPAPSALRPARNALKPATDIHSAFKTSERRKLDHSIAMSAPRSLDINRMGKLAIMFGKQTRTTKSGSIHFPQGQFEGIIKKFMSKLEDIILSKFTPELENIIKQHLS
jgi:hypothetical protein